MTVGALCDLGVNPSSFEWELAKLDLGDFHMHFERRQRRQIEGVKFGIHAGSVHTHDQDEDDDAHAHAHEHEHHHDDHDHEHEHAEHEHAHAHAHHHEHEHEHEEAHHHHEHDHEAPAGRSYADIRAMLEGSELSDFVKKHALSIFHRIAVAEAKIHGQPVETIGFHEVGALDSIADIVCACAGIEELGVDSVYFGPLTDGHGWIDCAHGRFPVPAPAALEILRGRPISQIDEPFEMITPTGAAIVAEFAARIGLMPAMTIEKIGYGLGTRDLPSRPNVLRAVIGELASPEVSSGAAEYETDTVTQIETNLDDLSPEMVGALTDRLFAAGALDAFLIPAQMKKNRPGVLLTVLCQPEDTNRLAGLIFSESSAFGVRLTDKPRLKLARRIETVSTPHGPVRVKLGFDKAGRLLQVAPEFESCRAVAEKAGQPVRAVYQAAIAAYRPEAGGA